MNEQTAALEREIKKLKRENARIQSVLTAERSAYTSLLNQEKTRQLMHSERERYLMLLLANSPNIIFFLGKTGRLQFCTDYFINIAGYDSHDEIIGHQLSGVLRPFMDDIDLASLLQCVEVAGENKVAATMEISLTFEKVRSDFSGLVVPMKRDDDSGMMILLHDITVINRSREEAEAANAAKSSFLSNMSHEMRTPLNAIIGMANIGHRNSSAQKKDDAFNKIKSASSYLLSIINDVLDIAKIESGMLELSPVDFQFGGLIDRVVDVVSVQMNEKNQHFAVHIDPGIPPHLYGDDDCLAQVLTNILANASKFTPGGGAITLNANLVTVDENNVTLQFSIKDEGIGMTPEEQGKIFNIFQQAEANTARKYGGSGLGLSITKQIINLMEGEITVISEKGHGSEFIFTITLPIYHRDNAPDAVFVTPAPITANLTGKNILVVDDVEINIEIVAALLESVGATVIQANSGQDAIRLFNDYRENCHLILMDLQMPEMDGLQATRFIRKSGIPTSATVPIIAMTANAFREDVDKCLAAGMDCHLAKPIDETEFMRVVESFL